MSRGNKVGSRRSKDKILNVRVADSAAGADGLRVDRMISAIKDSESQMRIMVGDIIDLGIPSSADTLSSYGFDQIVACDDFVSMAQQFNLFRITAIKFDVYDNNPSVAAYNGWGVWHENYNSSSLAYTRANIADLPDSRVISGGTGQTTLYWLAHGTAENQFQNAFAGNSTLNRFGGLKYFIGNGGTAVNKYTVQVHAVVDFRGRK